jgi:hypothetical protein
VKVKPRGKFTGLQKVSCVDNKEAFNVEVSKRQSAEFPAGLCVRHRLSPFMGSDSGWTSTVDEGTWGQYV